MHSVILQQFHRSSFSSVGQDRPIRSVGGIKCLVDVDFDAKHPGDLDARHVFAILFFGIITLKISVKALTRCVSVQLLMTDLRSERGAYQPPFLPSPGFGTTLRHHLPNYQE